jgi:hypothetical protein
MHGFSEEDLPVAIGHVLGLRWFQLTVPDPDGPPVLRGARGIWEPGLNTATCLREAHMMAPRNRQGGELHPGPHPVPVRRCGCGYWAYWHLGDQVADAPHIAGLVKGSGKVIKGPAGFRCEQAEIVALVPLVYERNAALALEAVYGVDVYGTIEALLEMHKAPPTQIPLADDYFRTAREAPQPLRRRWYPVSPSAPDKAPCLKCSAWVCKTGQALCGTCETAREYEKLAAAARKATTGIDALNQLHARREGWAKTAPPILILPTPAETEAIVRQKADTSAVRASLDYIKARFGDGSWWRTLQHPGK